MKWICSFNKNVDELRAKLFKNYAQIAHNLQRVKLSTHNSMLLFMFISEELDRTTDIPI